MKYIWEEVDVVCGRRVWYAHRPVNGEYLIGYRYSRENNFKQKLNLVSLSDGAVYVEVDSSKEMADWLNENGYRPADVRLPDIQKDG